MERRVSVSWEEDGRRDSLCPCGAGTYTVIYSSNDWNSHRESWTMNCDLCRQSHRLLEFAYRDSGRVETGRKWATVEEYEASVQTAAEQRAAAQARDERIREVIAEAARKGRLGVDAYALANAAGYDGGLSRFYRHEWRRAQVQKH
jgi:hypothetical protein